MLHKNGESFLDNRNLAMSKDLRALADHVVVLVQAAPKNLFEFRELAQIRYSRVECFNRAVAVNNVVHVGVKS